MERVLFIVILSSLVVNLVAANELSCENGVCKNEKRKFNVAVIGAGIGGSSSSHYLRDLLKDQVDITVYERNDYIGGRTKHVEVFEGVNVELGGAVYHIVNYLVRNFSLDSGFKEYPSVENSAGIWDGKQFVFQTHSNQWINYATVLWRYGFSPLRARNQAHETKDNFTKIYYSLSSKEYSEDPSVIMEKMFGKEKGDWPTGISTHNYLQQFGVSELYLKELSNAFTRVNYGQDTQIHALGGLICHLGNTSEFLAPQEGMSSISKRLLENSKASIRLNTKVEEISFEESKYKIISSSNGNQVTDIYDGVIIAAPLDFADISFKNIEVPPKALEKRPYQTTHTTIVVGERNKAYFKLGQDDILPDFISHIDDNPFTSLAVKARAKNGTAVFKIFSRNEISDQLLNEIFVSRTFTYRHKWEAAYPFLRPTLDFPPFKLGERLYYNNAIETMLSVLEASTIAANNNVGLLVNELQSLL